MRAQLLIVLAMASCSKPAPNVPVPSTGDACRDAATAKLPAWRAANSDELVVARLYQTALAACAGPDVDSAMAAMVGAANVDDERAARMMIADQLTPAQYLAVARDRSAKLRAAAKDPTWARARVAGDRDNDLVPDDRDRCPDSPELSATDPNGCPRPGPLPAAPSAQDVHAALAQLILVIAPGCDGAPAPAPASPVQLGYDRVGFRGGLCTRESTKELCFDQVDNDCNGLVDEGCGGTTTPRAQIVVSRTTNEPGTCVVFYEVDGVLSASDGTSPPEAFHLVFRDFEDTREALTPPATAPLANFKFSPGQTAGRDAFFADARKFDLARWRVRAVTGAGLAAVWSDLQTTPLTFTR